ncbi:MAG: peroxiredoxin [Schleiferiaceae bacterium]|jgi:peroxiredoxin Q/BCP|nr:peroxiredoxin [Schleiferiaceae bacterium]
MKQKIKIGSIALLVVLFSAFGISLMAQKNGIAAGDKMPQFSLKDDQGLDYSPNQWEGKKNVVIYFYPKDDTPGCTKESCSFRDHKEEFDAVDAVIIGVSSDGKESHQKFKQKYNLTYTLLSDTKKEARKLFGVPTSLLGLIPGRVTYVFDKKGNCVKVFNSQTKPEKHIDESLEVLKAL